MGGQGKHRREVLAVQGLSTHFSSGRGTLRSLEDVSFAVAPGETLALVGESGSGKSVTCLSILDLLPPAGRVVAGDILFRGWSDDAVDLAKASPKTMRKVRGSGISMVFQEPMTALNPSFTVGFQVAETIRAHQKVTRSEAMAQAEALLAKVGITDPKQRLSAYPHQLSGGMRQRVVIAMAIACRPALLIADEPTTALDVTTQAQVLRLLRDLQAELGMGMVFITHNLALVPMIADRLMVMYAGQIVESGDAAEVLAAPKHPYTRALLECLPARHLPREAAGRGRLPAIDGTVPDLVNRPAGCAFYARCPQRRAFCLEVSPSLDGNIDPPRQSRCLRSRDL